MKLDEAIDIFEDINQAEPPCLQKKGEAIWMVTQMSTHNSIKKSAMIDVIRWLLNVSFEVPKEFEDANS